MVVAAILTAILAGIPAPVPAATLARALSLAPASNRTSVLDEILILNSLIQSHEGLASSQ